MNIKDSHKKVRYADYIYMVRLRYDLNVLSDCVKEDVLDKAQLQQMAFSDMTNMNNSSLVPFEVKITKAKDGSRNMSRWHLFAQNNLRIYEKLDVFYADLPQFNQRSRSLQSDIELLNVNSMQSIPVNYNETSSLF